MSKELVQAQVTEMVTETKARVSLVSRSIALLWGITFIDRVLLAGGLEAYGVRPRSLSGLAGILAAPFLHAGWGHLLANTVPFAILGFFTMARKRMDFWVVAATSAVSGGLAAWLLGGSDSVHIGVSGVVFGFLGFLMGRGVFERRVGTLLLSGLTTFFFGGLLMGVLPVLAGAGISWQAHLGGWLGGLLVSRTLARELRPAGGARRG